MYEFALALLLLAVFNPAAMMFTSACCTSGDCVRCSDASITSFQVVIAGVTDGFCSNCDAVWNATFILPRNTSYTPTFCNWRKAVNFTCNGVGTNFDNEVQVFIQHIIADPLSDIIILGRVNQTKYDIPLGYEERFWQETLGPPPAVCNVSALPLPFLSSTSDTTCDFTAATYTVTAIP